MNDLRGLYSELILDHSRRPRGRGLKDGATGSSQQRNPVCGDEIELRVRVDGDRVVEVSWEGHGCAISQASASVLAGLVEGETVAESLRMLDGFRTMLRSRGEDEGDEDLLGDAIAFASVGRYSARVKCAMLPWVALEAALG